MLMVAVYPVWASPAIYSNAHAPIREAEGLGLWIEQTEGAKFWLKVFNDLKNRGVADVLIAVVDGLRGFPEAIEATFVSSTSADGIGT
jgi:hypothetical protein